MRRDDPAGFGIPKELDVSSFPRLGRWRFSIRTGLHVEHSKQHLQLHPHGANAAVREVTIQKAGR